MNSADIPLCVAPRIFRPAWFALWIASAALLSSQTAPKPAAATQDAGTDEEALILNPFEVSASKDMGYEATETLAGTRLNSELKDVATQVNVMNREFLEDLAITSLDDAMLYSLNTENRFEAIDVNSTTFGESESTSVVSSGQGGRTRGLSAPNNSHDFFDTFTRQDSYNTERFTFASGPNSVLFGNSGPAGTIDTTYKRAGLQRKSFQISNRVTSTDSVRLTVDLNQPLVRNLLALRVSGLTDRDKHWRKPGFANQDRIYLTLTFRPIRQLTVRAYHENGRFNQQPVKNTLVQDHVTPWVKAGRPSFDNALGKTLLSPTTNPKLDPSLRRPNTAIRAIINYDASGFLNIPITNQSNLALTSGYPDILSPPDDLERSITDESVYPYDRSFNGNASQAKYKSWTRGATAELNPLPKLFIEAGINEEQIRNRGVEFMDARVHELNADPNLFLADRVTPNPKVGQFYVEDAIGGVNNTAAKEYGHKKQMRVSTSYELNFEHHRGWTKWLGMHRLALLWDNLESTRIRERSLFTISPYSATPVAGNPYAFVTTNANSQQVGFRYYIDPKNDDWTIRLPFDVNTDGVITQPGWKDVNGKQVYLASFDPSAAVNAPTLARNRVKSLAFVTRSHLLNRRAVVSYARRNDHVDIYSEPDRAGTWNFDELIRTVKWLPQKDHASVNTVKSVVLHPLPWISFAYSDTTTQEARTEVVRNLDGTVAALGRGTGKDYGFTLRYKNLFSVRLNRYENQGIGNPSSFRNATPTSTAGALGPNLRTTVGALERSVQVNAPDYDPAHPDVVPASMLSPRFAAYQKDLAFYTDPTGSTGTVVSSRYDVISDNVAKGYELTLVSNPTPNWRIAVTGARNTAQEMNIGGQFWDFIRERLPIWGSAANLDPTNTGLNKGGVPKNVVATTAGGLSTNYRTYAQVLAAAAENWYYIQNSEGQLNNNVRKYRLTATTRYSFGRGTLKGLFLGGNASWRSAAAIGYPYITISNNPWVIPGVAASTISMPDTRSPYRGGALTPLDAFFGYGRRLLGGKVNWRMQLNIRNVLDRDNLLAQRALSTGEVVVFTPQEPRSFILTNTFSF